MDENLKKIIELIKEGKIVREIIEITGLNDYLVEKYFNMLNNPKSEFYNPELFKELVNKKKENTREYLTKHRKPSTFLTKDRYFLQSFKDSIINQRLSLEQTANMLHCTIEETLAFINQNYNESLRNELLDLFKRRKENPELKLSSLPENTQEEIILMALTYRLSIENLMFLFKTNIDDIEKLFYNNNMTYYEAINFLRYETSMTSKEAQEERLIAAKNYWLTRNKYLKTINDAKSNNNEKVLDYAKQKLKEHRTNIDDTIAFSTIGKPLSKLTELEKEKIVQYRIKYGLSLKAADANLKRGQLTMKALEDEVETKNPDIALSLEFLKNQGIMISNKYGLGDLKR